MAVETKLLRDEFKGFSAECPHCQYSSSNHYVKNSHCIKACDIDGYDDCIMELACGFCGKIFYAQGYYNPRFEDCENPNMMDINGIKILEPEDKLVIAHFTGMKKAYEDYEHKQRVQNADRINERIEKNPLVKNLSKIIEVLSKILKGKAG